MFNGYKIGIYLIFLTCKLMGIPLKSSHTSDVFETILEPLQIHLCIMVAHYEANSIATSTFYYNSSNSSFFSNFVVS
jgi:hypothetical protein